MDPDRPAPEQEEQLPHGIGAVEIGLTVLIVVLLIGTGIYYYMHGKPIGGRAALQDPGTVAIKLEEFFKRFALARFAGDGKICVIAPVGGKDVSFAVRKAQGIITVRQAGAFGCDGLDEDFILRYVDAEQFLKQITNPDCKHFLTGGRGNPYWYLPSKLWPQGALVPTCNAEFREKYCPAIAYCIEPSIMGNMFSCCAMDQLSPLAQRRMNEARQLGESSGQRAREAPT